MRLKRVYLFLSRIKQEVLHCFETVDLEISQKLEKGIREIMIFHFPTHYDL